MDFFLKMKTNYIKQLKKYEYPSKKFYIVDIYIRQHPRLWNMIQGRFN